MKKIYLLIYTMFLFTIIHSQTKEETELFLDVNLEKLNTFKFEKKNENGKLVNDISIQTINQIYKGRIIIVQLFSDFYQKKYKTKHKSHTQIIDISQIYSIQMENLAQNLYAIRIKSKSNCFEYFDKIINIEAIDNLDIANSKQNCTNYLMIFNFDDEMTINKTIKAIKHLVKINGGKIVDDIF